MRVALDDHAIRQLDAAGAGHTTHIVTAQIEELRMLGAFLVIGQQIGRERRIFFRRRTPWTRTGNRPQRNFGGLIDRLVFQAHQNFRR